MHFASIASQNLYLIYALFSAKDGGSEAVCYQSKPL